MACCALKKEKKQLMVFSVVLYIILFAVGGAILTLLAVLGLFSTGLRAKRDGFYNTYRTLLKGLKDKILYKPFIVGCSTKSRLTGKLMKFSDPLAGMVFKYFNLILLSVIALSAYLVYVGYQQIVI